MSELLFGSLEVLGLTISGSLFYYYLKKNRSDLSKLRFMEQAEIFSPSTLIRMFTSDPSNSSLNNLYDLTKNKEYTAGKCFVEGVIDCDRPLISSINKQTKLVFQKVSLETIIANASKFEEEDQGITVKVANEFIFRDEHQKSSILHIGNALKADFKDGIRYIDSSTYYREMSNLEKLLSSVLFFVKLFLSISNLGKRSEGIKVGYRKVEVGAALGQSLIALGEVFFDRMNKELKMLNPQFFVKNKESLVNRLRERTRNQSKKITFFTVVMVLLTAQIAKRFRRYLYRLDQRRADLDERRRTDKLYKINRMYSDHLCCLECKLASSNTVLKPCLHIVLCNDCVKTLEEDDLGYRRCPICTERIIETVQIFVVS